MAKGKLYAGTSNIVVSGTKQDFPEAFKQASRLHYYASLFNTVELNTTFYKLPMPSTFGKWSLEVTNDFQFTVKLLRDITHAKELDFKADDIDRFLAAANNLQAKKGCLLVQFPASITIKHRDKVEQILKRLKHLDPDHQWRKALEFRSSSWYNKETYSLLDKYHASIVLHDMPKSGIDILNTTANFVYVRYHGEKGDYKGSYSDNFLQAQAEKIQIWLREGKDVYAYFNNTMGNALGNVQTLIKYIKQGK